MSLLTRGLSEPGLIVTRGLGGPGLRTPQAGSVVSASSVTAVLDAAVDESTILEIDAVLSAVLEELLTVTELVGNVDVAPPLSATVEVIVSPDLLEALTSVVSLEGAASIDSPLTGTESAVAALSAADSTTAALVANPATSEDATLEGDAQTDEAGT